MSRRLTRRKYGTFLRAAWSKGSDLYVVFMRKSNNTEYIGVALTWEDLKLHFDTGKKCSNVESLDILADELQMYPTLEQIYWERMNPDERAKYMNAIHDYKAPEPMSAKQLRKVIADL